MSTISLFDRLSNDNYIPDSEWKISIHDSHGLVFIKFIGNETHIKEKYNEIINTNNYFALIEEDINTWVAHYKLYPL
jgi:hypothetical protein